MNHAQAQPLGKWYLSIKSYRSTLGQTPGAHIASERNMYALTMDENVFILLEDPAAPTRADVLAAAAPGQEVAWLLNHPSHYRNTFLTLKPPGALEQLLEQIKARWVSVRSTSTNIGQRSFVGGGQQLTIEGHIFAIGTDWLVRIGNVVLAGGQVKGMLLEVLDALNHCKSTCSYHNDRPSTFLFQSCILLWPMELRNYCLIC